MELPKMGAQPAGASWVETRLAEVVTLDYLGEELEEEPLEVQWIRLPATEKIAFDHRFETSPETSIYPAPGPLQRYNGITV